MSVQIAQRGKLNLPLKSEMGKNCTNKILGVFGNKYPHIFRFAL